MKDFQHLLKIQVNNKLTETFQKNRLLILSLVLFFIVCILFGVQQLLLHQIQKDTILPNPFPQFSQSSYPLIQHDFIPEISAQGAFVVDTSSKVVLFSKNPDIRFSPASTTKIMTILTALDYYKLSDILTVKRNYVEGSGLHLFKGQEFTFENLLYAALLPSANDAAYAIADNYKGGIDGFLKAMNAKAQFLNLTNTYFADPAGLEDDGDYTSPRDLATIASFAIGHPEFAKIVNTEEKVITDILGANTYELKSTNKLLGLYGVNGLKTGTTDEAGQVLVTSAVNNDHTYILVVMKSDDRFADTEKLLRLITNNVIYLPIHP